MQDHTQEPWSLGRGGTHVVLKGGDRPHNNTWIEDMIPLSINNFERAKECVNAMAGIEDVEEWMTNTGGYILAIFALLESSEDVARAKILCLEALALFPKQNTVQS